LEGLRDGTAIRMVKKRGRARFIKVKLVTHQNRQRYRIKSGRIIHQSMTGRAMRGGANHREIEIMCQNEGEEE